MASDTVAFNLEVEDSSEYSDYSTESSSECDVDFDWREEAALAGERRPFSPAARHPQHLTSNQIYKPKHDPRVVEARRRQAHADSIKVGMRVVVRIAAKDNPERLKAIERGQVKVDPRFDAVGSVRFVGSIKELEFGPWIGVELDSDRHGRNLGRIGDRVVFPIYKNMRRDNKLKKRRNRKKYGLFARPEDITVLGGRDFKVGMRVRVRNLQRHEPIRYDIPDGASREEIDDIVHNFAYSEAKRDVVFLPQAEHMPTGVVRFVGQTMFQSGVWLGIEMDGVPSEDEEGNAVNEAQYGRNFGMVEGTRYFLCKQNQLSREQYRARNFQREKSRMDRVRQRQASKPTFEGPVAVLGTSKFTAKERERMYTTKVRQDTIEHALIRKKCERIRRKNHMYSRRLVDVKMKPVAERQAFGVFVRPSDVEVDTEAMRKRLTRTNPVLKGSTARRNNGEAGGAPQTPFTPASEAGISHAFSRGASSPFALGALGDSTLSIGAATAETPGRRSRRSNRSKIVVVPYEPPMMDVADNLDSFRRSGTPHSSGSPTPMTSAVAAEVTVVPPARTEAGPIDAGASDDDLDAPTSGGSYSDEESVDPNDVDAMNELGGFDLDADLGAAIAGGDVVAIDEPSAGGGDDDDGDDDDLDVDGGDADGGDVDGDDDVDGDADVDGEDLDGDNDVDGDADLGVDGDDGDAAADDGAADDGAGAATAAPGGGGGGGPSAEELAALGIVV